MRTTLSLLLLIFCEWAFSAACPTSGTSTSTGANNGDNCTVTGSQSTIQLNFISGFDSSSSVSVAGGNNGTTLGAQRKLSFVKAAEILADQVASGVTIIVDAEFSGLSCNATSATLGSAGASANFSFSSAPAGIAANTFYPIGLINAISGVDYATAAQDIDENYSGNGTGSDVVSNFNSNIGQTGCLQTSNGWYYGFDSPPSNYIGFTTVLLHEITHGLGFASLVSPSTGAKASGVDDIFSNHLYASANASTWSSLTNAQRLTSLTSSTGLLWDGSEVNTNAVGVLTAGYQDNDSSGTFTVGDRVEMYAPNPAESGSSISHFNTAASPNELMEPSYTEGQMDIGLALYLLKDLGWTVVTNTAPTLAAVDQTTNEDTPIVVDISGWGADADGDSLTYSVASCPSNISCSLSSTTLTLTPATDHNGPAHTVTIDVTDGEDTTQDTFNLAVTAVNDDPSWSSIPTQNVTVGTSITLNLDSYTTDTEGDSLTYSVTTCPTGLTCNVPTNTLTLTANSNAGSSVSVTVEADDANGGTPTTTFSVLIGSATPSTQVEFDNNQYGDLDQFTLPLNSNSIAITNGSGSYAASLEFNGQDVSHLISISAGSLDISMPSSGEFAGEYTLEIIDQGDGDIITLTVVRPLRATWSSEGVLYGDNTQTLTIEGGAAGSQYNINQSPSTLLTLTDENNQTLSFLTAENNAQSFNRATGYLTASAVSQIESINVTITNANYDDVVKNGVSVYPSVTHTITIENTSGELLSFAQASLDENASLVSTLNLETDYNANSSGEITVLIPDTSDTLDLTISGAGYQSQTVTLDNITLEQTITLSASTNTILISGNVMANSDQNFNTQPPSITLTMTDDSSQSINVVASSASQTSFSYTADISQMGLKSLRVQQQESKAVDMDLTQTTSDQSFSITLEKIAVATSSTSIGSPGAGVLKLLFLLLIAGTLIDRRRSSCRK